LNQGDTKFLDGSFVPVDPELLDARVKEARSKFIASSRGAAGLQETIELRDPGDKEPPYENGNAYAIKYDAQEIPRDSKLLSDTPG
jgi:hypothetical protein